MITERYINFNRCFTTYNNTSNILNYLFNTSFGSDKTNDLNDILSSALFQSEQYVSEHLYVYMMSLLNVGFFVQIS